MLPPPVNAALLALLGSLLSVIAITSLRKLLLEWSCFAAEAWPVCPKYTSIVSTTTKYKYFQELPPDREKRRSIFGHS